jgi:hypothetical protein
MFLRHKPVSSHSNTLWQGSPNSDICLNCRSYCPHLLPPSLLCKLETQSLHVYAHICGKCMHTKGMYFSRCLPDFSQLSSGPDATYITCHIAESIACSILFLTAICCFVTRLHSTMLASHPLLSSARAHLTLTLIACIDKRLSHRLL